MKQLRRLVMRRHLRATPSSEPSARTYSIISAIAPAPCKVRTQLGHRMGEWHPLIPTLVAEVQFDHFTGGRSRRGAKFMRWRPDKEAVVCTMTQASS